MLLYGLTKTEVVYSIMLLCITVNPYEQITMLLTKLYYCVFFCVYLVYYCKFDLSDIHG